MSMGTRTPFGLDSTGQLARWLSSIPPAAPEFIANGFGGFDVYVGPELVAYTSRELADEMRVAGLIKCGKLTRVWCQGP